MDGNEDIFKRLMNDEAFREVAGDRLVRDVYQAIRHVAPASAVTP